MAANSLRAAHKAAVCSATFDGMQPTRAQVVPSGPRSISTKERPAARTSRMAYMPALPAPMMATSIEISGFIAKVLQWQRGLALARL